MPHETSRSLETSVSRECNLTTSLLLLVVKNKRDFDRYFLTRQAWYDGMRLLVCFVGQGYTGYASVVMRAILTLDHQVE